MKKQSSKSTNLLHKQKLLASKKKQISNQVINLQQEITDDSSPNHLKSIESLLVFINQKCSVFFNQSNNEASLLIEQHKLEMMLEATQKYPQFSHQQLERLVERDWRYMSEAERKKNISESCEGYCTIEEQLNILQKQIDDQILPMGQ